MHKHEQDRTLLKTALILADIHRGFCYPNPAVGAVIVNSATDIIARGYHQGAGKPHAEIEALKLLNMQAEGATLYVTLEPCCHWGKTPPCTKAIIEAGIKRVVYGYRDPNPLVSGKGVQQLTDAGIACEYVQLPELGEFYASYCHWHLTQKPFVTAKIAMSLNGCIAGKNGLQLQITGNELQQYTHIKRKKCDAILTTGVTIMNDNPSLNVRIGHEAVAKPIYIIDTHLKIDINSKIFSTAKSITIFHSPNGKSDKISRLVDLGVRCLSIEATKKGINLSDIIAHIGRDSVHDLWVEAGGRLLQSLLDARLVNKLLLYVAPKWITQGYPAFTDGINYNFNNEKIVWQNYGNDIVGSISFALNRRFKNRIIS